jgi:hypothetical protein
MEYSNVNINKQKAYQIEMETDRNEQPINEKL